MSAFPKYEDKTSIRLGQTDQQPTSWIEPHSQLETAACEQDVVCVLTLAGMTAISIASVCVCIPFLDLAPIFSLDGQAI